MTKKENNYKLHLEREVDGSIEITPITPAPPVILTSIFYHALGIHLQELDLQVVGQGLIEFLVKALKKVSDPDKQRDFLALVPLTYGSDPEMAMATLYNTLLSTLQVCEAALPDSVLRVAR